MFNAQQIYFYKVEKDNFSALFFIHFGAKKYAKIRLLNAPLEGLIPYIRKHFIYTIFKRRFTNL